MNKEYVPPTQPFNIEDQAYLKALGISGLSPGMEYALKQQEAIKASLIKIENRAEGLVSLELNEGILADLARERNQSIAEVEEGLQFFRDLDPTKKEPGQP